METMGTGTRDRSQIDISLELLSQLAIKMGLLRENRLYSE